jgi:hypothetical protein
MTEQAISPSVTTRAISPSITTQAIRPSVTTQAISPSVTTQAIRPSLTTQAISPLRQRMIEDKPGCVVRASGGMGRVSARRWIAKMVGLRMRDRLVVSVFEVFARIGHRGAWFTAP